MLSFGFLALVIYTSSALFPCCCQDKYAGKLPVGMSSYQGLGKIGQTLLDQYLDKSN